MVGLKNKNFSHPERANKMIWKGLVFFLLLTTWLAAFTAEPFSGQYSRHQFKIDQSIRNYGVYVPAKARHGASLLIMLHASQQSEALFRTWLGSEFDEQAEKYNFIVAFPDGIDNHWNDCRSNASYTANQAGIDDVTFLSALIKSLTSEYQVNEKQVFVAGYSNGGHMAFRLALEKPELMRGIGIFSASLPSPENSDCQSSGIAVSIASFNGTTDPISPYLGGTVRVGTDASRGTVLSVPASVGYWRALAELPETSQRQILPEVDGNPHSRVILDRWFHPDNAVEVRLYTLEGSGHVVPSLTLEYPPISGGRAADISGAAELLAFFSQLK
jgi:polyhydroxybutyrate depolymerase